MIQFNNPGFIYLRMVGVNWVSVKKDWLMGVCFNTMLVLLIAMIVLSIQMRMRWYPLDHQKGSKQKENKSCVGALLDHDGVEFNPDFPLALVARAIKRLKMCEKNQKMCGRRSHSTLTNIFWILSRRFSLLTVRSRGLMENLGLT